MRRDRRLRDTLDLLRGILRDDLAIDGGDPAAQQVLNTLNLAFVNEARRRYVSLSLGGIEIDPEKLIELVFNVEAADVVRKRFVAPTDYNGWRGVLTVPGFREFMSAAHRPLGNERPLHLPPTPPSRPRLVSLPGGRS